MQQEKACARPQIVSNGEPNAVIVISEDEQRPRMLGLAALELQYYLEKISGARLPIVTEPQENRPVTIYVGKSEHTERLGVTNRGLKYGACRIVSGDSWLALLGQDHDFSPPDPVPRSHGDIPRARRAWDRKVGDRTDAAWGYPYALVYKERWQPDNYDEFMAERYGVDNKNVWDPRDLELSKDHQGNGMGNGLWLYDWGGSFNAVCEYLRSLGVRWYMPGVPNAMNTLSDRFQSGRDAYLPERLSEVIPERTNIPLPDIDRTIHPDFPARCWLGTRRRDWPGIMWKRRIGINSSYEVLGFGGTHGMAEVLIRDEMKEKHPEYYAVINGKRVTGKESGGAGEPCFSSDGLVDESVAYLRFRFEEYNERMVQFSPPDGLRKCQCDECKNVPVSDLVFGFMNRVARKLYRTHPDHIMLGSAYTPYTKPPENIDQFPPNFAVTLNNRGRPRFTDPERWKTYWASVEKWHEKVDSGHLLRAENNRYEIGTPPNFPVLHPHAMARDLQALNGISLGERNEISLGRKRMLSSPALSHLTLYVNARFLWDANRDIDELLDTYYQTFYGPASAEMKTAFSYAEKNNCSRKGNHTGMNYATGAGLIERLLKARKAAGKTKYRERIEMILEEIVPENTRGGGAALPSRSKHYTKQLHRRSDKLARRDPGDRFRWWNISNSKWKKARENAELDGVLDEAYWRHREGFKDKNGRATRFGILLSGHDALFIGIRSERTSDRALTIPTRRDGDPAILEGDHLEFLLETDVHSFYQIAINPAGAVLSRDLSERNNAGGNDWKAQAEVGVHIGEDHWSVEMRIPLTDVGGDPLHNVAARRAPPRNTFPWFFNVINARVENGKTKTSAYVMPEDPYEPAGFAELSR